jgi:hypothetical protein
MSGPRCWMGFGLTLRFMLADHSGAVSVARLLHSGLVSDGTVWNSQSKHMELYIYTYIFISTSSKHVYVQSQTQIANDKRSNIVCYLWLRTSRMRLRPWKLAMQTNIWAKLSDVCTIECIGWLGLLVNIEAWIFNPCSGNIRGSFISHGVASCWADKGMFSVVLS